MLSQKYGRTYHFPFSPGTTSDDRINHNYWEDIQRIKTIVHTEKLDGENNCLNRFGVFARSHATPAASPWTSQLRERWNLLKNDLDDIELFGENLYAVHSIEYKHIESYFHIFAVRCLDTWLSWEEVKFYAALYDFPNVPELLMQDVAGLSKKILEQQVLDFANGPSIFGSVDTLLKQNCTREGIVTRNIAEYQVQDFAHNVFKYVRKGHVKTDQHWTLNWQRAKLRWEKGGNYDLETDTK